MFGILASAAIIVLSHIVPALADVNSWSTNGPSAGYARAIAFHPFDSQTIFMGSHNGFWKTTDGGENWLGMPLPGSVHAIKADPIRPNIIYAACNTTPGK